MEPPDEYHPEEQRTFIDKWSEEIYYNGRFTMIPNLLLAFAHPLGITPAELVVLLNIESFRWNTKPPHPSIPRLALRTGMSERHISRIIASLDRKDIIKRRKRRNQTNSYDITPLIEKLHEIALAAPDNHDISMRLFGIFDTDIPDTLDMTQWSSKTDTLKTDTENTKVKNIPRNKITGASSISNQYIDLDEIEF